MFLSPKLYISPSLSSCFDYCNATGWVV